MWLECLIIAKIYMGFKWNEFEWKKGFLIFFPGFLDS
jgi:hypothetical protein